MNSTQRGIGIIYTAFASWVILSAIIGRAIFSRPIFYGTDLITILCILLFAISIFIESKLFKIIQVSLICLVAIVTLESGEQYLPLALFTNAFFIAYSYGWLNKLSKIKMAACMMALYCIYSFSGQISGQTPVFQINLFVFVAVHVVCMWFVFRSTISKAMQYDKSKEIQLSIKLDEAHEELLKLRHQLNITETQLKNAAQAGLELVEIVKELKKDE